MKKYAVAAGRKLVELALQLYCVLQKDKAPAWVKASIIAGLGYFIFPIDAIPDAIPVVGYSDDIGVLTMIYEFAKIYLDKECKKWTKEKLKEWFGKGA